MRNVITFLCLSSIFLCYTQENSKSKEPVRIPGVLGYTANFENYNIPKTRGESIPFSYSLRKYAPPIGDQGDKGTCVGWATTYAGMTLLENIELKRMGSTLDYNKCYSPQMTYDICKFSYDDDCEDGTYIRTALEVLKNFGSVALEKYPYQCNTIEDRNGVRRLYSEYSDTESVKDLLIKSRMTRLKSYIALGGANIVENVKYSLYRNMPVVIGCEMYHSIQKNVLSGVWNGAIDIYPGGHAMCVIGYDDKKEGGAFEILNSWGNDWADSGIVWFRYSDFVKVVDEAYALTSLKRMKENDIPLYNYNFTISAIGKQSSSLLEVNPKQHYKWYYEMSIGGFDNDFVINYPTNETKFKLSIKNNIPDGFYAYAFSICCGGKVSLIYPMNGTSEYFEGTNSGLIVPSDQFSGIPMGIRSYEGGTESCVLLCKNQLNAEEITNSLTKNYSSLRNYVQSNFLGRVSLNSPSIYENYTGSFDLLNTLELNDIQPFFFTYNEIITPDPTVVKHDTIIVPVEKTEYSLFNDIKIKSKEWVFTYFLEKNFKRDEYASSYDLRIAVKRNWLRLGFRFKVSVIIDNVDNLPDYKLSFNSKRADISDKLLSEIFTCLSSKGVAFRYDN